jgi:hypothetical protein
VPVHAVMTGAGCLAVGVQAGLHGYGLALLETVPNNALTQGPSTSCRRQTAMRTCLLACRLGGGGHRQAGGPSGAGQLCGGHW